MAPPSTAFSARRSSAVFQIPSHISSNGCPATCSDVTPHNWIERLVGHADAERFIEHDQRLAHGLDHGDSVVARLEHLQRVLDQVDVDGHHCRAVDDALGGQVGLHAQQPPAAVPIGQFLLAAEAGFDRLPGQLTNESLSRRVLMWSTERPTSEG